MTGPSARSIVKVLSLLVIAGATAPATAQGRMTPVRVEPAQVREVAAQRMVTGEIRAMRRSDVAGQEAGLVIDLPVREGQIVEVGDPLATLDSRRLRIMLEQIEADSAATEALREERQAELEWRQRDLLLLQSSYERGAANPRELQDAESQVSVARARVLQAGRQIDLNAARAELLRERLADMTIAAPFRGIVVARHIELGEWLGEGDPVIELVSTGPVEAWFDVPQTLLDPVQRTEATLSARVEATGELVVTTARRVVPLVDPLARTFILVARLDNERDTLAPGMSVTAWVPTGAIAEQLTVPKNAVLRNDAGAYVFVARGAGEEGYRATPASVEVLFGGDDWVAVRAPALRQGDLVVVEGNERLFPMMAIEPIRTAKAGGEGGDS